MATLSTDQILYTFSTGILVQKSLGYAVKPTISDTKGLTYAVLTSEALTKGLVYAVVDVTRLRTDSITFSFDAPNSVSVTKNLAYTVLTSTPITKSLGYEILGETNVTKGLTYRVRLEPAAKTKTLAYNVASDPSTLQTDSITFSFTLFGLTSKALAYTVRTEASETKALTYAVRTEHAQTLDLGYTITQDGAVFTKDLAYKIEREVTLGKQLKYTVTTEIETITIDPIGDRQIFQRDENDEATITVSGEYDGTPTTIEARIVENGTSTEVITWAVLDATPTGGEFSGTISNVPVGGWYNVQVRFSNNHSLSDTDGSKFAVGILIALAGQSNIDHWSNSDRGTDLTPNDLTAVWRRAHFPVANATWRAAAYNGEVSFLNTIYEATGVPVGIINWGIGSTGLLAGSYPHYWLNTAADQMYSWFLDDIEANGGAVEAVVFYQGETEALAGYDYSDYLAGREQFYTNLRADITHPFAGDLPIITPTLGRYNLAWGSNDANWNDIQQAILDSTDENDGIYLGATLIDLALGDNIHISNTDLITAAARIANTFLYIKGEATYYRGPNILGYQQISSSIIDIIIGHVAGTNFTPTSAITEFDVLDSGSLETITSAVRLNSSTIRLTISGTITGTLAVRYMYGAYPAVTGAVKDNSSLTLPLELIDDIPAYTTGGISKSMGYEVVAPVSLTKSMSYSVQPEGLIQKSLSYSLQSYKKNQPYYIKLSGGLSMMLGKPRMSMWSTGGRPSNPKEGTFGINTSTKKIEFYATGNWYAIDSTQI